MAKTADRELLDLSRRFVGFTALSTPSVIIDAAVLEANIAGMQARVGGSPRLHPHVKTHKSIAIARRQLAAGAAGITTSRPPEAAVFIRAGIGPVTIAYPLLDIRQIDRLLELGTEHGVVLRFIADSEATIDALARARLGTSLPMPTFLKVDVGLGRIGVDPQSPRAIALAERIGASGLDFQGLISHAGHAYGAGNPDGIARIARQELDLLHRLRDRLSANGTAVPAISIGSTPTLLANAGFDGVGELRPGNYVFLDLTAVRLGIAVRNDLALGVAATVVASNDTYSIIDAGSKTLSSDLGAHGARITQAFGEAWVPGREEPLEVARLSEEHGFVEHGGKPLAPGTRLVVLPNHSCPVANLAQELVMLSPGGHAEAVPVDARNGSPVL
ncbi:MAG: alanine racemase [Rhizobiaceae bacterium]